MTTCALYLRISDDPTGLAAGVQRQETECRELASRLGFEVGQVYVDNDVSALSGKRRPAFEQLLTDRPRIILAWHPDRLVKRYADLERIIELNLVVHTVMAGAIDLSTPTGRAVARTVTAWAAHEGELKAARQVAANRQRRDQGLPPKTRRAFGYEANGEVIEVEAALVQEAYRLFFAERSLTSIAAVFNDARATTTRGAAWSGSSIAELLANPRYAALVAFKGTLTGQVGTWTPLVTPTQWRATQAVLTASWRRGRVGSTGGQLRHLLSGIATCGVCHGVMRGGVSNGKDALRCEAGHVMRASVVIDEFVIRSTQLALHHPKVAGLVDPRPVDTEALRVEAEALRDQLRELAGNLTISLEVLAVREQAIRARLEMVDGQLSEVLPVAAELSTLELFARWDELDLAGKRTVIERCWSSIEVKPLGRGNWRPRPIRETVELTMSPWLLEALKG